MKYEPITVQHPMIEPGNDGAIDEFERLLDEGRREWTNRNKLIVEEAFQQLCDTLLRRLQGSLADHGGSNRQNPQ